MLPWRRRRVEVVIRKGLGRGFLRRRRRRRWWWWWWCGYGERIEECGVRTKEQQSNWSWIGLEWDLWVKSNPLLRNPKTHWFVFLLVTPRFSSIGEAHWEQHQKSDDKKLKITHHNWRRILDWSVLSSLKLLLHPLHPFQHQNSVLLLLRLLQYLQPAWLACANPSQSFSQSPHNNIDASSLLLPSSQSNNTLALKIIIISPPPFPLPTNANTSTWISSKADSYYIISLTTTSFTLNYNMLPHPPTFYFAILITFSDSTPPRLPCKKKIFRNLTLIPLFSPLVLS